MGLETAVQRVVIGDYSIARVEEMTIQIPLDVLLPRLEPEFLKRHIDWLVHGHYDPVTGLAPLSIHSWLLRTRHQTILVDACAGNHKPGRSDAQADFSNLETPYLERLTAAGATPVEIDFVMCTHLHVDHVGWNTRLDNGRWVPTFPNAKYLFSKTEFDYWSAENQAGGEFSPNKSPFDVSVAPVMDAGLAQLIDGRHEIEDNVVIHPRPGHTPGHVNLHIGKGDDRAIFSGDIMHHPIQAYRPDWSSRFCESHELACQTRLNLLEACADEPTIVLPAHFNSPHMVRVTSDTDGFSLAWIAPGEVGA